jgi:hypothetical protein
VPPAADSRRHGEDGTASVELIATVPFLLFALAVAVQATLAGHALWSAGVAARAGARAALVGADAEAVARRALPPSLRDGVEIEEGGGEESGGKGASAADGVVSVRVRVPSLLPQLPPLRVGASSGLGPGDG